MGENPLLDIEYVSCATRSRRTAIVVVQISSPALLRATDRPSTAYVGDISRFDDSVEGLTRAGAKSRKGGECVEVDTLSATEVMCLDAGVQNDSKLVIARASK